MSEINPDMLSIEDLRKTLLDEERYKYTDEELRKINTLLDALADVIFDKWLAERNSKKAKKEGTVNH